jgi:hypothetical protein
LQQFTLVGVRYILNAGVTNTRQNSNYWTGERELRACRHFYEERSPADRKRQRYSVLVALWAFLQETQHRIVLFELLKLNVASVDDLLFYNFLVLSRGPIFLITKFIVVSPVDHDRASFFQLFVLGLKFKSQLFFYGHDFNQISIRRGSTFLISFLMNVF